MHHANSWLMALSFLLGLLFWPVFTVRRVKREVPVSLSVGGLGGAKSGGTVTAPGVAGAATAGAAGAAAGGASAKLTGRASSADTTKIATVPDGPFGPGSAKAGAGGSGPAGWTIKGNEDSMLYHTTDSPFYDVTIPEVWFREEQAAEAAGFTRWDRGVGHHGAKKHGSSAPAAAAPSGAAAAVPASDVPPGPYGSGSAKAGPGGSGPVGWTIKGNADSMLYHGPQSPAYDATIAEVWFRDEQTAEDAGFARWDSWRKKKK